MIKAVCFDLDGVYFTEESFKTFKQKIVDLGVEYSDVEYILHKEPMLKFKKGEIEEQDFWKNAINYWKVSKTPNVIIQMLYDSYTVNPQVAEYVKQVKAAGFITCICSNNFVTRVEQLNKKFNFLKDFDTAVFSYRVGVLKPDSTIFKILLDKANVEASQMVYSDDGEDKIKGAIDLGINAFVYKDFDQFKNELSKLGVSS
jgi:epoxide hydrolase-like predicted phosphatase